MSQADTGAIDIGAIPVETKFSFAANVLGGKGFVNFHQLEVCDLEPASLHEVFNGLRMETNKQKQHPCHKENQVNVACLQYFGYFLSGYVNAILSIVKIMVSMMKNEYLLYLMGVEIENNRG